MIVSDTGRGGDQMSKTHHKGKVDRRARYQKPQAPAMPLRPTAAPPEKRPLLKRITDHPVVLSAGLVVLLVALAQAADWALSPFDAPEIHVTGSDASSPFVFPFSLKNNSKLLSLENVKWDCIIRHMEFLRGSTMDNVGISSGGNQATVESGKTSNHICRVMNRGVPIQKLVMDVAVEYDMLHHTRDPVVQRFTWISDGDSSKWVEGDVN
jgi:hypothetical protein